MKQGARRRTLPARLPPAAERPLSPARAFVVQFREETDGPGEGFTGRVEHMVSGHTARFESAQELIAFLVDQLRAVQTKHSKEG